jgi:hypothetical protein
VLIILDPVWIIRKRKLGSLLGIKVTVNGTSIVLIAAIRKALGIGIICNLAVSKGYTAVDFVPALTPLGDFIGGRSRRGRGFL